MSFSYDITLTTDMDWVRLLSGDRTESSAVLSDEEILGLLAEETNKFRAAAMACRLIVSRTGSLSSKQVEDLQITYDTTNSSKAIEAHIKYLMERGAMGTSTGSHVLRML